MSRLPSSHTVSRLDWCALCPLAVRTLCGLGRDVRRSVIKDRRSHQANEGWNRAELDARTQVARIEWAVSGLTSNTVATHCWKVRARCGASPGAEESRYRLAAGAMSSTAVSAVSPVATTVPA